MSTITLIHFIDSNFYSSPILAVFLLATAIFLSKVYKIIPFTKSVDTNDELRKEVYLTSSTQTFEFSLAFIFIFQSSIGWYTSLYEYVFTNSNTNNPSATLFTLTLLAHFAVFALLISLFKNTKAVNKSIFNRSPINKSQLSLVMMFTTLIAAYGFQTYYSTSQLVNLDSISLSLLLGILLPIVTFSGAAYNWNLANLLED